ncbi:MAG: hypothetical protein JWO78_1719 [Micavibrio sp.]|nr:hypothetical protein [Micavibrio sp.]
MGEIFQSMFNDVAGNDKATRDAATLPMKGAKLAVGMAIIPMMIPSFV